MPVQTPTVPTSCDVILVGGGHAHALVLRQLAMRPIPGLRLTLVAAETHTPYSGMLPGLIAGAYQFDETHIDLARLAEFAGARFIRGRATGLDRERRLLHCAHRPPITYDLISFNTGAAPAIDAIPGAREHAIAVKPIAELLEKLDQLRHKLLRHEGEYHLCVIGAGAGGIELMLALAADLRQRLRQGGQDENRLHCHLVYPEHAALAGAGRFGQKLLREALRSRQVQLHQQAVTAVHADALALANGTTMPCDAALIATEAVAPAWLANTGLTLDEHGFIRTRETLQSLSDDRIFAAGDVASMDAHPRPKAGVMAVRAARPLAANLERAAQAQSLRNWRPQGHWLALLGTGDGDAIALRGRLALQGRWLWRWKQRIDRRFMRKFSELPSMDEPRPEPSSTTLGPADQTAFAAAQGMRCGGCGAKLPASVLQRVLPELDVRQREDVLIGLNAPDDAAVIAPPAGQVLVQSTDFFREFLSDPYLFARIAANHCLGDLHAMAVPAHSALALVTLPAGLPAKQADTLRQLMQGALDTLNELDCSLLGGHSGESEQLALGFTINGFADAQTILRKTGAQAGDRLILTKSLGSGSLLVAHAKLQLAGRDLDAALDCMLRSNAKAGQILRRHQAHACTDVTGFGLAGHLLELLGADGPSAQLSADALPRLAGVTESLAAGHLSSLHAGNRDSVQASLDHTARREELLFDPQTAGGLLASVPADQAQNCVTALRAAGDTEACVIGEVEPAASGTPRIRLT